MSDMSSEHLTGRALVDRVKQLQASYRAECSAALALAPGREGDVFTLMLVDDSLKPRTAAMDALRVELGLPDPIAPSSLELGRLSCRLYKAPPHGTASASAVGG
ncbi:hypothetical protein Alide_2062 [Alicycliphilus denitrificans BC]|nr:hypothetical protein Alide_2062 [Alicycliphilus denitrificans BC]